MTKSLVYFLKKSRILATDSGADNSAMAMSLVAEFMQLGFALTEAAYKAISKASVTEIVSEHLALLVEVRKLVGADKNYRAFYKNFPQEVMQASDFKLWVNAMAHYWSNGLWEPSKKMAERGFALEKIKVKPIDLGTNEDFNTILPTILSANGSLTEQDKKIVEWFFKSNEQIRMPESVPFKETLCQVAVLGISKRIHVPVKTATDVLRVATYMSGGDISLPPVPKLIPDGKLRGWYGTAVRNNIKTLRKTFLFKKFSRLERRYLLSLLESCKSLEEDMWRHRGRWLRMGEILHPGEYKDAYPKTFSAFQTLREGKVTTFMSRVEKAREDGKVDEMVSLLSQRPGEFARRLDDILRDNPGEADSVLNEFILVGSKISTPVLTQLYSHFRVREKGEEVPRIIKKKGRNARMQELPPRPPLTGKIGQAAGLAVQNALVEKFKKLGRFDTKVFIADELFRVPLPAGMRAANTGVRAMMPGTRIPFGDFKVLRAFVHWTDTYGNIDIDLSANFLNERGSVIERLDFRNLRVPKLNAYHSGDVRHRQGPCAEYIDVDVEKALAEGMRLVTITVFNYNGRALSEASACGGWMGRDFPESNLHFLPTTLQNAIAIANEGSSVVMMALDLKTREIIWVDASGDENIISAAQGESVAKFLASLENKLTVGDLLGLHCVARGGIRVQDPEEASIIFGKDMMFEYDRILSEFMQ